MASTFTLNIRATSPNKTVPTILKAKVYPLATPDGPRIGLVKDTAGNVVLTGHTEEQVANASLLTIANLPDPRSTGYVPTGFGLLVKVEARPFHSFSAVITPAHLDAYLSGGVLELEDVVESAIEPDFDATTVYATASELTTETAARVTGDNALPLLSAVTASAALTKGRTQLVNALNGAITMTALPALTTLAIGDRYGWSKTDTSRNAVTVPFAGGDTTVTGSTSSILTMTGTVVAEVVANPSGSGKVWRTVDHLRSDQTIDRIFTPKLSWVDLPLSNIESAHRGVGVGRQVGPQETIEGYDLALALGVSCGVTTILDIDSQTTADNIEVAMHDTTTDLTTGISGTVASIPYLHLPAVYQPGVVGSGWGACAIPTQEQLILRYRNRAYLTIEAKSATSVPALIATIKKYGVEQSVFINYYAAAADAASVFAQVNAAGIGVHAYGLTDTSRIDIVNANGGAVIGEVPTNASASLVQYAKDHGIYRVLCTVIDTRAAVQALPTGVNGWVTDSPGYLARASGNYRQINSISRAIATGKVGVGWKLRTKITNNWLIARQNVDGTTNTAGGLYLQNSLGNQQQISPGDMCGTIGPSGTVALDLTFPVLSSDLTRGSRMRVLATTEDGTGQDTDTNGYVFELRQNGNIRLYTSSAVLGNAGTIIGKIPTGATLVAGTSYTITFEWSDVLATINGALAAATRTSLPVNALKFAVAAGDTFTLLDGTTVTASASAALGATSISINSQSLPAINSGQMLRRTGVGYVRGIREDTFATLSAAITAGTKTSIAVNALTIAVAANDKLVLPDGTEVNVSGAAAIGATSIPITSQTLPAVSSGSALRQGTGWVANTDWRGAYHYLATSMSSGTGGTCLVTDFRISDTTAV